jgi:hypothetical protein
MRASAMISNQTNKKNQLSPIKEPIKIGDITFDDDFFGDDQKAIEHTIAKAVMVDQQNIPYHHRRVQVSEDDFWKEEGEEENLTFFEDSKINQSIERAARLEANLFRRFSIGLYESDIALLDKLVAQGKNAKLTHISKAHIVREALRHFKLSWISDYLQKD